MQKGEEVLIIFDKSSWKRNSKEVTIIGVWVQEELIGV